jgi:uncharacterized membrane protein
MEESLAIAANLIATIIEGVAVAVVAGGAVQAFVRVVMLITARGVGHGERKAVWRGFGMWLILGLEFALAADIVRTVVSTSWEDVGRLGAIAVIRTFLNYFLEQDLERAGREGGLPLSEAAG